METILGHAQRILYTLLDLMPSPHQRLSFQAIFALFFEPTDGHMLPEHSVIKSPAALSRFLNNYGWPTRAVIRASRRHVLEQVMKYAPPGRRPHLQVIIDLTTLEKRGKFKAFENLIHVLNGKKGLHLVIMYIVVGQLRMPWAIHPWRGKGTDSPAKLGLKLLRTLPKKLLSRFQIQVLADTGFSSVDFLQGIRKLRHHAIVGIPKNRKLEDGRKIRTIGEKGQQVKLSGFKDTVSASWFYLERNGKLEKRFVISTRKLKGNTITWWGRRRWAIEGFFKTSKYRFGLAVFGQQTLLGVYRWLVISLISFILVHWVYLSLNTGNQPDWRKSSAQAIEKLMPEIVVRQLLIEIEAKRALLASQGLRLELVQIKI